MPRGSKAKYTTKQKRQARHIEEGVRKRGGSSERAKKIAWATVNKETGGGKKSGSGRGRKFNAEPSRKGGKIASTRRSRTASIRAGRKAAATRKRRAA